MAENITESLETIKSMLAADDIEVVRLGARLLQEDQSLNWAIICHENLNKKFIFKLKREEDFTYSLIVEDTYPWGSYGTFTATGGSASAFYTSPNVSFSTTIIDHAQ